MRILTTLYVLLLAISLLGGCGSGGGSSSSPGTEPAIIQSGPEPVQEDVPEQQPPVLSSSLTVRVGTLKGPAGMGMAPLMQRNEEGTASLSYDFTLAAAPDELSGRLISGELDIAAVPTNVASVLYNKTGGNVTLISTTTLGVLYLLTKDEEIGSFADLNGKTIYSTGQGSTQEYVLRYLLRENGLDPEKDVTIEFKAAHDELAALMLSGQADIALLPQPFVTTVTTKDDTVRIALDITAEWERVTGTTLAMGSLVARNDFVKEHKAELDTFLREYEDSVDMVNDAPEAASEWIGKFDIIAQEVAVKAIPQSNIACITGERMRSAISAYLAILFEADPSSVGGSLPDEGFYYPA